MPTRFSAVGLRVWSHIKDRNREIPSSVKMSGRMILPHSDLSPVCQGSANFCKEPERKCFRLSVPYSLFHSQLSHCAVTADVDNMQTNGHGCVTIKLIYEL